MVLGDVAGDAARFVLRDVLLFTPRQGDVTRLGTELLWPMVMLALASRSGVAEEIM